MISFNVPPYVGNEMEYIAQAIKNRKICGDGEFTSRCSNWLEEKTSSTKALLTTSCTHALEMAALLCNIQPGDEVIMPSYTFVSTANAFVLRGAKIKFVDIRPDTMNIDEKLIEQAITSSTKAIVPVHYAGVSCEMDTLCSLAQKYHLYIIEDAAQGVLSTYKNRMLGSIGDFGCFSFHETKNFSMGEGGALLIKARKYIEDAEIIREKGTNRSQFFRGQIDKYTWINRGSSYLPSELNAAYLWAQLLSSENIFKNRMNAWELYYNSLKSLKDCGLMDLPIIPCDCQHNAHMFYIKVKNLEERSHLITYLKKHGIGTVFHYIPLHSSPAGQHYGEFIGEDLYTTKESERLLRLPLWYGIQESDISCVTEAIKKFYYK